MTGPTPRFATARTDRDDISDTSARPHAAQESGDRLRRAARKPPSTTLSHQGLLLTANDFELWWAGRESNPQSFRGGFTDRWARHVPFADPGRQRRGGERPSLGQAR